MNARKLMHEYRHNYPNAPDEDDSDDENEMLNVQFQRGEIKSRPERFASTVHEMHGWTGNMKVLEKHHTYIQWLFPTRELGTNEFAHKLTAKEARILQDDAECRKNILQSYEMMLHFYGLALIDRETGAVEPLADPRLQFRNLVRNGHNWRRLTRIFKSLGELGFEHFKLPLLRLLLKLACTGQQPLKPLQRPLINYWALTLRNRDEFETFQIEIQQHIKRHSIDTF